MFFIKNNIYIYICIRHNLWCLILNLKKTFCIAISNLDIFLKNNLKFKILYFYIELIHKK